LAAVNKELESFTYSVSHDLKAPLRGIDGYSQLLQQECSGGLNEEGRGFVKNIRQGAEQMNCLIEDLLDYSRMERRPLQSRVVDLPGLVQAVVAERGDEIRRLGAELRLDVPAVKLNVDRDGLAVVLRNLLENALKFHRPGALPIVEFGGRDADNAVILWVRDNGIGFDMKFHERIFEIFQRLQRSEEYPGTGIGLALVRKAMSRLGGRVWAESIPGQGATFYLELPR
jgi:light-regulated signal transduction histidine kinase (bacteriophytochrome)